MPAVAALARYVRTYVCARYGARLRVTSIHNFALITSSQVMYVCALIARILIYRLTNETQYSVMMYGGGSYFTFLSVICYAKLSELLNCYFDERSVRG